MAFNDFHVDSTASDNNSGTSEGSSDVSGTNGSTDGTTTVDLSGDTPDLSGVVAGDAIRINGETGGINSTDIFEIASVNDGADTLVVIQTPGTASSLTWAIGGAWATIDRSMKVNSAGNKIHVKATADYTELVTIIQAGTATAPIVYEGYTTTKGDSGKSTIDGGSTRANCIVGSGGNSDIFYVLKNLILENATADGLDVTSNDQVTCKNCEFNSNGSEGGRGRNGIVFERCSATGNTGSSFRALTGTIAIGCESKTSGTNGFSFTSGITAHCMSFSDAGTSFSFTGNNTAAAYVVDCTIDGDGKDTTTGINFSSATIFQTLAVNNIIYDCATGLSSGRDLGELASALNNLVNSNTTNYVNSQTFSGEVTGAPLFTSEGSDWSLQSGSPAKAAGIDAGIPSGDGASYMDIGAIQRQEPAGGGGLNPILGG